MAAPQPLRVVVTGGAGFVGRNLCQRLLSQGHFVISVDSFLSSREEDSERLKQSPSFGLIEWDISEDQAGLKAAIEGKFGEMAGLVGEGRKGIDQIYNLACPASPPTYQAYPFITMKTNFTGAMNMLELAREYGATILQASTSEIYGEPQVHPQVEEYWGNVNTIGVRSCYDEGKRIAETLFSEYHRQYGTDIRIVRIFNTYGPEMHPFDGRVVSNFIIQALSGRDISIYGDGQQTRSFLFVSDLVEGLVRMMNTPVGPEPINLGNPDEFTVRELADLVLELIESPSKIIFEPPVSDDPSRRKPDITRARTRLHGWEPTVKLRDGLSKTIEYFRQLDLSLYKKFPGVPSFVQALKQ